MGAPVTVKNAADAWVNQNQPKRNYGNKARLYLRGDPGNQKKGYIFFAKPSDYRKATQRIVVTDDTASSIELPVVPLQ